MKFSENEKHFKPFSIEIESEEEAVIFLNVLASYYTGSMSKMLGNDYYSNKAQSYSNIDTTELSRNINLITKELRLRIG